MRTIAVANQKGGCGKTTTTVNLATAFAEKGKRVLVVDLDPQGHATLGFGYEPRSLYRTVYDSLVNAQIPLTRIVVDTKVPQLDLAPSNILLSGAEVELAGALGKELVLGEQLRMIGDAYDMCVIDCPPSLGFLTLNGLVASTDVIVPVQAHYYAIEGLRELLETANIIKAHFYPCDVEILGLLLTLVEERTIFCRQIQHQMRAFFGSLVFDTVIHQNVRLAEAPSAGEPVLAYAPNSKAAAEYRALAEEIIGGAVPAELTDAARAFAVKLGNTTALAELINGAKASAPEIADAEI